MRKGIYRSGAGWYISRKVRVDGGWKVAKIRGYASKRDANADYDRALAKWERRHSVDCQAVFFDDLRRQYEEDRERKGIGLQTRVNCDKNDFSHMSCFKGRLLGDAFSEASVREWHRKLCESCSADMANRVITRFRDVARFAWASRLIGPDAYQSCVAAAERVREDMRPRKERVAWTMGEEEAFLAAIPRDSKDDVMFRLAGAMGCRIGEFLALKAGDYDRKTGRVVISHQIIEGTGEGRYVDTGILKTRSSYRERPLPSDVRALLEGYIAKTGKRPSDYLFTGIGGRKPLSKNGFRRLMDQYIKLAGVPRTTPHGLRHTMSTWLGGQCRTVTDVAAAAKMTGNSPTVFLDVYASHIRAEDEDKLVNGVSSEFGRVCEIENKKKPA
jgi:integrase